MSMPSSTGSPFLPAADGGLGAAVGEEFDRAETEGLIAVAGGEAVDEEGIRVAEEVRGVGEGEDGDRQGAVLGHTAIKGYDGGGDGSVVDGSDTFGEEVAAAAGDEIGPAGVVVAGEGKDVGAAPGGLQEAAGGGALAVAEDDAAGRVRSRVTDADSVEAEGIDEALVQGPVGEEDGAAEFEGVEAVAGDGGAGGGAPVEGADPGGAGLAGGLVAEGGGDVVLGGGVGEVGPAGVKSGEGEVVVGVDEAGNEETAAEVATLGLRVGVEQGMVADCGDAVAVDEADLGRGAGLHGADAAAEEGDGQGELRSGAGARRHRRMGRAGASGPIVVGGCGRPHPLAPSPSEPMERGDWRGGSDPFESVDASVSLGTDSARDERVEDQGGGAWDSGGAG